MKKQLFLGAALILSSLGIAQNYLGSEYVNKKKVNESGIVKFVAFKSEMNVSVRNSETLLKQILETEDLANAMKKVKSETDPWGGQHDFYKQYFNGVEVAHKSCVIHSKNGIITSMNGDLSKIDLPTNVSELKTPSEIYKLGLADLGDGYEVADELKNNIPFSTLVVLPKGTALSADRYAYTFNMLFKKPGGIEKVYIDAVTGKVLKKESLINTHQKTEIVFNQAQTEYINTLIDLKEKSKSAPAESSPLVFVLGTADTRFNGVQQIETKSTDTGYELNDESRAIKTLNATGLDYLDIAIETLLSGSASVDASTPKYIDADNNWTSAEYAANKDDAALDTHWAFSKIYDFFSTKYNRHGFDNQNSQVWSFIHATQLYSSLNSAWINVKTITDLGSNPDPNVTGGYMFIGDGGSIPAQGIDWDIVAGLDVIAHEHGHGLTNSTANLIYERESGALNEAFSDIWGASIEANVTPQKQRWIIGEDFVQSQPDGIRSLADPKMFNQPNTYLGQYWKDATPAGCVTPDDTNDKCGVHTNSGVLNYWYYLLTEGGSGTNDNGYAYQVTGIGIEKSTDISYSVLTNYLQSGSTYPDTRDFSIQAAEVLYGANSSEVTAVKAAWCAVGVTTGADCSVLAVSEVKNTPVFSIYPNPVNNELTIISSSRSETGKLPYKITNMAGQLIQQGNVSDNKVNVSILQKGTYIISIDEKGSYKFIKN